MQERDKTSFKKGKNNLAKEISDKGSDEGKIISDAKRSLCPNEFGKTKRSVEQPVGLNLVNKAIAMFRPVCGQIKCDYDTSY